MKRKKVKMVVEQVIGCDEVIALRDRLNLIIDDKKGMKLIDQEIITFSFGVYGRKLRINELSLKEIEGENLNPSELNK